MQKIIVMRSMPSSLLSIVSGKHICHNFKFSSVGLIVYQWRTFSPAAIKMVLRTSSNFSKAFDDMPFSMKYQCHFISCSPNKRKPKVDLSHEVALVFSTRNSNLIDSETDSVPESLQSLIKPEASTLDDIQVKYNGAVKCRDKNSVISVFNINSINPLCFQEINNFHMDLRNASQENENCRSVSNMNLQNYFLQPYILNCLDSNQPDVDSQPNTSDGNDSNEHLAKIYDRLCQDLPCVFVKPLDYGIYCKDIIFENLINGTKTVGLVSYIRQVSFMRIVGHFKYAYVKFDILKITKHPEDSTVRIRWRISGVSALKSFGLVWKQKGFSIDKSKNQTSQWHDGFSVFHVGSDGLIFKHVADKMIPDEERVLKKPSIVSQITSLIGSTTKTPAPQSAMNTTELSNNKTNLSLKNNDVISVLFGGMQSIAHPGSSWH